MIADLIDFSERRFCAELDRRVRAAELEEGVAELNATLGKVSSANLQATRVRVLVALIEAQCELETFETSRMAT